MKQETKLTRVYVVYIVDDAKPFDALSKRGALEKWAKSEGFENYCDFCEQYHDRPKVFTMEEWVEHLLAQRPAIMDDRTL